VDLKNQDLAPQHAKILAECEPFLISYAKNWPHVDLAPMGCAVREERLYDPCTLRSRTVIDDLHTLDSFSFGPQDMLMPRWVLFDCGEFPGIVFGFGKRAGDLPVKLAEAYKLPGDPDRFVPLSMWVAIPCAEPGAWFGHNLSSANYIAPIYPGLATLTKAVGMGLCRAAKQYGATQWDSSSIGVHMNLGDMRLLSAWTPAHTHIATFAYLIDVDGQRLVDVLRPGWERPASAVTRTFDADDMGAMRALHADLERGERFQLAHVERRKGQPQRIHITNLR
jgi:hypothetical protein